MHTKSHIDDRNDTIHSDNSDENGSYQRHPRYTGTWGDVLEGVGVAEAAAGKEEFVVVVVVVGGGWGWGGGGGGGVGWAGAEPGAVVAAAVGVAHV